MKKNLKQFSFLALIAFTLIFTACESNEDTLLVEEQNHIQALDPSKIIDLNALHTNTEGRAEFKGVLLGNNNRYISSENGDKAMTCNRVPVGPWEIFTFVPYPSINNAYVLRGNNGRYVRRMSGSRYLRCNVPMNHAEPFYIVNAGSGKVSLWSARIGRYISSENGARPITCYKTWQYSQERFTLALLE